MSETDGELGVTADDLLRMLGGTEAPEDQPPSVAVRHQQLAEIAAAELDEDQLRARPTPPVMVLRCQVCNQVVGEVFVTKELGPLYRSRAVTDPGDRYFTRAFAWDMLKRQREPGDRQVREPMAFDLLSYEPAPRGESVAASCSRCHRVTAVPRAFLRARLKKRGPRKIAVRLPADVHHWQARRR